MKFVHAADLHVDSPLVGLERYEGAPVEQLRQATRRALQNLVTLCIQESAAVLVLAGDLFDGEWRDYSTGLFFVGQMQRLRQAGVSVVIAKGNHDAQSQVTQKLSLPDNVREFGTDGPESFRYPEAGLIFHGQSYAHRAEHRDLAAGYPDAVPGLINVGVLHTCATGRPGHEAYAPCKLETLIDKRYDYWALGHIHEREVLCQNPWVVFPGNLQARHMKETGPKGATVVEYDASGITSVEHRVLDVVRFVRLDVSATNSTSPDDLVEACFDAVHGAWQGAEERGLVARVRVWGATSAHQTLHRDLDRWSAEVRARANELPGVWVERLDVETQPAFVSADIERRADALGQILRAVSELRTNPEARKDLLASFDDLRAKLPPEVKRGAGGVNLEDPDALLEVLGDVESLFQANLYPQGDT
jgi:DNA repair protein SbcD/Mre11